MRNRKNNIKTAQSTVLTERTQSTVLTERTQIRILCIRINYVFLTILKITSNYFPESFNPLAQVTKDFLFF